MDFRQFQYIMAIAEYRNITRAADSLYISQSALSHYLKATEAELGVQLFDRSTSPLSLTYAGRCYIESAKHILHENNRLMKELRDITDHMTGRLSVGISRNRESYTVPRLMPVFSRRYPGITLDFHADSGQRLIEALRDGRVDLILLPAEWESETLGLESKLIYSEELVLTAKKGVFSKKAYDDSGRFIKPEYLKDMPFFTISQAHALRRFTDGWFRKSGIHPPVGMEFTSNISCYRMAATGMGCAIVPYYTTRMTHPGGYVELFSLDDEPQTWDIHMFYRKDQYLGRPERDLIDIAREVFANEMLTHLPDCNPRIRSQPAGAIEL